VEYTDPNPPVQLDVQKNPIVESIATGENHSVQGRGGEENGAGDENRTHTSCTIRFMTGRPWIFASIQTVASAFQAITVSTL
jgi:hypothetical protein